MSDRNDFRPGSRRMPANSLLYEKAVPLMLALLSLALVLVLLVALAAVLGWIRI